VLVLKVDRQNLTMRMCSRPLTRLESGITLHDWDMLELLR